ncbi:hypothetical protein A2988_03710 [Candidatus Azambacteria bacterium RIFCSPLOWO2_01_FULL_46_25]|uniref:Thymidylate kinase-like domain-containing protein n=1 Tax=Candidatus Azambacteria bacterium RIFCSPLOWO2_01_FULL_46_25 TaxID=1797298 RepID=A0A1F5BVE4_9BACT|nr:MAG: hypothetical protein A2988_03710 [Candidatus Azambacteria bacterium RIFCSPLOWO2_01_FULL_46_25]OGD37990.1 MAG: hypothetical protein A2850_00660 [Candidatus Azambacteria bacterium RIFCSPHIGHO2_01_FULL_51_74]
MLVLFEGMPGSGKTTQMREVKHALEKLGHAVLVPNTKNKFIRQLERVIKQRKLSFVSPLRELILWKIKELQDANLRSVVARTPRDTIILFDSHGGRSVAYSQCTLKEYRFGKEMWGPFFQKFLQGDLTIFLAVDHQTAKRRKPHAPTVRVPGFFREVERNYRKLAKEHRWHVIDTAKHSREETARIIMERILAALKTAHSGKAKK